MDHIIWYILYGPHDMNNIIWTILYGPFYMYLIIRAILYRPYDMVHIIWTLLYGQVNKRRNSLLIKKVLTVRAKYGFRLVFD